LLLQEHTRLTLLFPVFETELIGIAGVPKPEKAPEKAADEKPSEEKTAEEKEKDKVGQQNMSDDMLQD